MNLYFKLYTVAVYRLRICTKEDNPGAKYFMGGGNKYCVKGVSFVIWLIVLFKIALVVFVIVF